MYSQDQGGEVEEKASPKKKSLSVNLAILKSANISIEEFQEHLDELKSILANRFGFVVPTTINDLPTVLWLVGLSQRLRKLKNCDGFDRHIKNYTREQKDSNYFVTVIASYFFDKVDGIVLEPHVSGTVKTPDILVNYRGEQVILECKQLEYPKFDYSEEHRKMHAILCNYIKVPHQIDINYKRTFSEEELHALGKTLEQRLNQVKGSGSIINNPELEVLVTRKESRMGNPPDRVFIVLNGFMRDEESGCSKQSHIYMGDGVTLALCGPEVHYSKFLKYKINKSRIQAPADRPYILIIDGRNVLGNFKENIRALATAFQPSANTRFSAAAFVIDNPHTKTTDFDSQFRLVSNPFAKFPISREFELLFRTP